MVTRNRNVCWAVPFQFTKNGRVGTVGGKYNETPTMRQIESAIITGIGQILFTSPGERVLNGNFGVEAGHFAFRPVGDQSFGRLHIDVEEQITLWEERAIPKNIYIYQNPGISQSNVRININMEYSRIEGSNIAVNFGV